MTRTFPLDATPDPLVLNARASDPDDNLPWLVCADWLDERVDPRSDRIRWWRSVRAELLAQIDWNDWRQVDLLGDVGPRIDRLSERCRWLARLYGIEVLRSFLKRYPLPRLKGRAKILKAIGESLAVTECYAFGLATDQELSAARSAAESATWSAAWSATWSAAWSATWSAAWSAIWSAAWSAAESAAWSAAESAAWSAAESAAWSAAEQLLSRFERAVDAALKHI